MNSPRIVLITGGSAGIGFETVTRFATHGDRVFTCSRTDGNFSSRLSKQLATQIDHRVLDVGDSEALNQWIRNIGQQYGKIDCLVNNAACVIRKPFDEFRSIEIEQSLSINLVAMLQASQVAIEFLRESPRGVLINLSSMAAIDPFSGFSIYGACKAFIELFTRALGDELSESKIRCFSIRAGAVETDLLRKVLPEFPADQAISPDQIAELIFRIALTPDQFKERQPIEITNANVDSFHWNRPDQDCQ